MQDNNGIWFHDENEHLAEPALFDLVRYADDLARFAVVVNQDDDDDLVYVGDPGTGQFDYHQFMIERVLAPFWDTPRDLNVSYCDDPDCSCSRWTQAERDSDRQYFEADAEWQAEFDAEMAELDAAEAAAYAHYLTLPWSTRKILQVRGWVSLKTCNFVWVFRHPSNLVWWIQNRKNRRSFR